MASTALQALSIRVVTLNIWGLWLVSKKRKERVRFLGEFLQSTDADLVLLQEVWVEIDAQHLIECAAKAGLRHAMHFKSGIFGAGLVTISRFPIIDSAFWRYSAAGDPAALSCGDFYAAKGLGWLQVMTPSGVLDVFNTHLHANYSHKYETMPAGQDVSGGAAGARLPPHIEACPSDFNTALIRFNSGDLGGPFGVERQALLSSRDAVGTDSSSSLVSNSSVDAKMGSHGDGRGGGLLRHYRVPRDVFAPFRISQMLELAAMIRHVARPGPGSSTSGVILGGDLNSKPDCLEFRILQVLLPELRDAWVEVHGHEEPGYTCHAPGNTYQPRRQVAERIDYILASASGSVRVSSCQLALQWTPVGHSYSDHFAVCAELQLQPSATASAATLSIRKGGGVGGTQAGLRQDVLTAAGRVLAGGIAMQSAHAVSRQLAAVVAALVAFLLVALAATGAGAFSGPAVLGWLLSNPMVTCLGAVVAVAAVACSWLAVVLFLMGFLADNTQRRALIQARAQLRHIAEHVQ